MEKSALILSIISIVATILIAIWQIYTTRKINKINLNSDVCQKIFDKYLIEEIPFKRRKLKFNCRNMLTGWEDFNNVLVEMKRSSLYFKYNDEIFYNKLTKKLTELEDFIAIQIGKSKDSTEHSSIFEDIDDKIKSIYLLINSKKNKG